MTSLTVVVKGAWGGAALASDTPGGKGGEATGTVAVTPGEALSVIVGGQGASVGAGEPGGMGGANGGGNGGTAGGAGGGGRSELDRGTTPLLVAGGGGGSATGGDLFGGAGGGLTGGSGGLGAGGGGGTQTQGGAGGGPGHAQGAPGRRDQGGDGAPGSPGGDGGGGGGGGYFGGGGGGGSGEPGGGGGGSGHLDPSVSDGVLKGAVNTGNGVVTISYLAQTTTSVSSRPNPSTEGNLVTITATITGTTPTGTVAFTAGGTTLTDCGAVPLGPTAMAICQTSALPVGNNPITAAYSGDSNNLPSTGAVQQIVNTATSSSMGGGSSVAAPPTLAPPLLAESPPNAFGFARVRARPKVLHLSFDYPGRGTLDVLVTTRRPGSAAAARLRPGPHRVTVGKLHDSADAPVTKTLRIPLTGRGRRILARRGKLPIRLSLVFTPDGGESARQARKFTVRR